MNQPTILCLTDFGRAGQEALEAAAEECRCRGTKLHVLHVHECDPMDAESLVLCPKHQIESDLRCVSESLGFENLDVEVRVGNPVEETMAVIEQQQPILVVIGTHRSNGDQNPGWIMSGFVQAILRSSQCPVLVCRGPAKIAVSGETSTSVGG